MCDGNYIKLNRKLLEWEWWFDDNTFRLWMCILLKANWKDAKFQGIDVPRGSLVTSQESLQKMTGMTRQNVRTALEHLKSTNEVTIKTYRKFSVITVVKYDEYQGSNQVTNLELTMNQPTTNHNIRRKEEKEGKNIGNLSRTYDFDALELSLLNPGRRTIE